MDFCIFVELDFAVHVSEQISQEFIWRLNENLDLPFQSRTILLSEKKEMEKMKIKFNEVYFGNNSVENQ